MNVLVTNAATVLGQTIFERLGREHCVRLVDLNPLKVDQDFLQGDVRDREFARLIVEGMQVVIHLAEYPGGIKAQEAIDHVARGTYNLLLAAAANQVERFVYASTLRLFEMYPEDMIITEPMWGGLGVGDWMPRPSTETYQLAKYLGELVCREFARMENIIVVCLRLGKVVLEEEVQGQPYNPMWVDLRDAAEAFYRATMMNVELGWKKQHLFLYHICHDSPIPKFPVIRAKEPPLGYRPAHNFKVNLIKKGKI